MSNSAVLDVPMKLGLELMAVVGADGVDPERKLFHDVVHKVDRTRLCVAQIDFQRANSRGIVNGGVLEPLDRPSPRTDEFEELDVDLDMVTRDLFFISHRGDGSNGSVFRQAVHPVAPEDVIDAAGGDLDVVVTHQVPDDPLRTEVVPSPQVQYLVLDGLRDSAGQVIAGASLAGDEAELAGDLEGPLPLVERVARDPEISARLRDISRANCVTENLELALNLPFRYLRAHSRPPEGGVSYLTCQAYS